MPFIKRKDLKHDYNWGTPGNNPGVREGEGENMFSREQGEDVLDFINGYISERDVRDRETALRIESLLYNELDKEPRSRREVYAWLDSRLQTGKRGPGK